MSAEFPYNMIEGQGQFDPVRVSVNVQSEYTQIDEAGLANAIGQWLVDNSDYVTSYTAERHEQLFPVTPIAPPAG
ncbi:MAG: hypothetical protein HOW71_44840 [Nonomuraea sp.]|nr:hypothetical protein [Nonomuraea sp.]NUQ95861.1 hypothetical protein [Streptomyces sp.]NUS15491.1 hypothetical protein [Streptomyces sp.]NUS24050.1 hypothetical protein [Streptomyces sp.]